TDACFDSVRSSFQASCQLPDAISKSTRTGNYRLPGSTAGRRNAPGGETLEQGGKIRKNSAITRNVEQVFNLRGSLRLSLEAPERLELTPYLFFRVLVASAIQTPRCDAAN